MDEDKRRPDTVTFTFETTIDYSVDLRTGEVSRGEIGRLADEYRHVALFCEGECASEMHTAHRSRGGLEDSDEELIDRAQEIMEDALRTGIVTAP